jgi:hypothetical protein
VTRSGLKIVSRAVPVALLLAIGTLAAPRPARAMGCHAPERPALGVSFSWERTRPVVPPSIRQDRPDPRAFVPSPCSGDVPGSSPREVPTLAAAPGESLSLEWPDEGRRMREENPPARPIPFVSRLDRPPRFSPMVG